MRDCPRVVITGLGVVSPIGIGKDLFWENLVAGTSGVGYITSFDASRYPCPVAAEVKDFDPANFMHPRRTAHRGRFSQFAVAAAKLALADSGLELAQEHRNVAACIGTAMNGSGDVYETARTQFEKSGFEGIPTMSGIEFAAHAPVSHISMELGLRGQAITMASACSTGLDAVQWGVSQIQQGRADVVLAGSTEASISEFCFATLCALGALSKFNDPAIAASRPYDLRRDGLVLGEGSAVFVLESIEHVENRQAEAKIYAEVLGFGTGNEGGFGTRINASELALTDAIIDCPTAGRSHSSVARLHQRARQLTGRLRPHRDARLSPRAWPCCLQCAREFHQIHDRPRHGRRGCPSGCLYMPHD